MEVKAKNERMLRIEEVALSLGVSVKTINNWYWFKRENPNNELAKLLPEFVQEGERQTRKWKRSDLWKLVEFKTKLPKGRGGIMGSVTQKYYHRKPRKEVKHETE